MTMALTEHEKVVGRMKRRFLTWFAATLAAFLVVMGFVVREIQHVADDSCAATNKVIDVMVDYNDRVLSLQVPRDDYQRETARLREENNRLLESARCKK